MDQGLVKQLEEAKAFFIKRKRYCARIREVENVQSEAMDLGDNYVGIKMKPHEHLNKPWRIMILSFFATLIFCLTTASAVGMLVLEGVEMLPVALAVCGVFGVIELIMLIPLCLAIITTVKYRKILKQTKADAEIYVTTQLDVIIKETDRRIKDINREMDEFTEQNKHLYELVPSRYRNARDVCELYKLAGDGRADTLKEAINLYEEIKARQKKDAKEQELQQAILEQMEGIREEQEWINHQIWMQRMNDRK